MMRLPTAPIAALIVLLALGLACGEAAPDAAPPTRAATELTGPISGVAAADTASAARRTAAPVAKPTATRQPTATPTADPCKAWDEITVDMKGEIVCMRGIIAKFSQSRQVGTRYSFSDKPNTFFLYSAYWEIINPITGKTIGPGTCVEVTATLEVQSDTPFMNIDKLLEGAGEEIEGFLFYDDPAACG